MAIFTDAAGREWKLSICGPTIRDVRSELDIDLVDLQVDPFIRLANDPCLLVDVLWSLCREQAKSRQVTPLMFAEEVVGDAIDSGTAALIAAVSDFFPRRTRELLLAVQTQLDQQREMAVTQAMDAVTDPTLRTRVSSALKAKVEAEIQQILLSGATASPASSESTPAA